MVQDRAPGSKIMLNVSATIAVLLLVFDPVLLSSARFVVSSATQLRRGVAESKSEPRTVALDLMHVEHVDSPYMQPNLTLVQRAQNAAKRSKQQLKYFSSKILGEKKTIGVNHVFSSPLFSDQSSVYLMQISIGTPARTFLASMDTGSDLIWLLCIGCTPCLTETNLFDPAASSSYTPLPCDGVFCSYLPFSPECDGESTCRYTYGYTSGAFTTGSMAYETFTLTYTNSSQQAFRDIAFGCSSTQLVSFGLEANGMVGLGKGPLSLVSQLGASINGSVFSYCLVDFLAANTTTSPLLIGSAGSIALNYTPPINNSINPTFYYLNLTGITVDGLPITYPSDTFSIDSATGIGGLVMDSGTSFTYLFDAAYAALAVVMDSLLSVSYPVSRDVPYYDLCVDTSSVATPVFPEVVFQFDGVDLVMPPNNVFVPVDTEGVIYCMFIASAGVAGVDAALSLFGNVQQQNFQIAYDIANARVGFAPTKC